jgi:Tfp pilus assembly protein PilE
MQAAGIAAREGDLMRAAFGFVGLLIVLLIGYLIYTSQIQEIGSDKPLKQQIDFVAVRSDLLSLAQAERLYYTLNNSYATLEELQRSNVMNSIPVRGRSGYQYTVEVDGATHFQITASPADSSQTKLPTLSINETMQISQ